VLEGEGKLDAQGNLNVEFTVPQAKEKETWDYQYRLDAQVTDASRRSMDGGTTFVGVRSQIVTSAWPERYVYHEGDTARLKVNARDREGRPVRTRVKLVFYERRWEKVVRKTEYGDEYPDYEVREKELSSAPVETSEQGEAVLDYRVPVSGNIQIKTVVEEGGREVFSEAGSVWVSDRAGAFTDLSYMGEGEIKLVTDKKSYRPGETAEVLALLPTDKAHLLVTTELRGLMSVQRIDAVGRTAFIRVPIEKTHAPNIFLCVTYVRGSDMYAQSVELVVPARDKLLKLDIIPNKKEYRPRETASYTVLARNADGSPAAGAEVSLGVVDESIYSIAPESVGDIRRTFYDRRYNQVQTSFSVNYYFIGYAGKKVINLAAKNKRRQFADTKNEGETVNPLIRKIFKDTAFWQPALVTGPDGKATAKFELPDNLTTWRATARAVTSDTRVGTAVSRVVERKDVIVRVALPRFLTAGDTVTLSGIAHNYLKQEKVTKINIDVQGARLLDAPEQTVSIPSFGEHRVNWRVSVPATGELKVLVKALTDAESDAVEIAIPVVPRGLKVTRAESAVFSEDEAEKSFNFNLPANADQNTRTFKVEVTPTVAGSLFGALDYLTGYPYGCVEQTMSRFLPTVIVSQTLQNVESATVRDTNDIGRKVRRGLRRLYNFQHQDGGWGWWKDDETDPWMTAYVVDGLAQARAAGYEVDADRLERARKRLAAMISAGQTGSNSAFAEDSRAYMTYALAISGGADARFVNDTFNRRDKLGAYGRALLALTLREAGDTKRAAVVASDIERTAKANASEANWETVEATALSVKALARLAPKSELLPKAARWLVRSRRFGQYWLSTRETAFAIFGLTDYLKVSQELSPDYAVEVYVNGQQVLAQQMTSAEATAAKVFTVQRRGGEVGGTNEVRVVKRGPGML
ncbi:MAG TPA: alpha-2-macroglobulin family protein, partial [Pyrinomonadaceae bacterium]